MKKIVTISMLVLLLLATSATAFAATSYNSPSDILSDLTNQPVENLIQEKTSAQTTYGAMASAAGVLEQFQEKMLALKEQRLAQRVANQTMTQEQADAVLAQIKERQATCDGTCDEPQRLMQQQNPNRGQGNGLQQGNGMRYGGANAK